MEPKSEVPVKKVPAANVAKNGSVAAKKKDESSDEKDGGDLEMVDAVSAKSNIKNAPKTTSTPQVEATESKTLFVGNLSFSIEESDVLNFFKNAGEVVDVRFTSDRETGAFKGCCHVQFATVEAAQNCSEEGEQDYQDMDVEPVEEPDKVSQALVAANDLGYSSKSITSTNFDDIAHGLQELDMDNYDKEEDGIELFSKGFGDADYLDNSEDPYLKDKDGNDSEELEDMIIKAEDSVIIRARNEEDGGHLEMWILKNFDDDKNMFIHHDILLRRFLLCTAWLDCPIKGGEKGNFIAVGSMEPAIEIWDLDIMDEVQPSQILGGMEERNKKIKNVRTKVSFVSKCMQMYGR